MFTNFLVFFLSLKYSNCWKKPKLLNASEPCNLEKVHYSLQTFTELMCKIRYLQSSILNHLYLQIAEDVFKHAKVVPEPPVATSHHHHPPPPVPPSSALPLQQPRQQEDTTNVSRMAPSLQYVSAVTNVCRYLSSFTLLCFLSHSQDCVC